MNYSKVIKEIRFYDGSIYHAMPYRCQVILDGTVIADGNFHKVDSLADQDSSAAAAHPDYGTGGDVTARTYWRLRFT